MHVPWSTSLLILEQHSNEPIRFEGQVYVKFRLPTRVRFFYISVILLSFSSDFRDKLWVGLGSGVEMGVGQNFKTGMLLQDQQIMLILKQVLLGKIMVTETLSNHLRAIEKIRVVYCADNGKFMGLIHRVIWTDDMYTLNAM